MAKFVGLVGTGSGRAGNFVFSKLDGVTIVRAYQPHVANPNTLAQIEQRAKLKLASQYAAALGDFGRHFLLAKGYRPNRRGSLVRYILGNIVPVGTNVAAPEMLFPVGSITHNGLYDVNAPVITFTDETDNPIITASYTPGTVQNGELVTLVLVVAPQGVAGSESALVSSQRVLVGGMGTVPPKLEAVVDTNGYPQYSGLKFSAQAFVLRSRPAIDTVLPTGANNSAIGGANGTITSVNSVVNSSSILASSSKREFSKVGYASLEVVI